MEACGSSYQQEYIQSLGGEDEDEDDVDHGRDEYEEMIGRDDFHENTINYENVDNVRHDVVDDHDDDAIEFQDDIGDGGNLCRISLVGWHESISVWAECEYLHPVAAQLGHLAPAQRHCHVDAWLVEHVSR
ncbi:hypothetical protein CMV_010188 [Castanea mollissima]|uniref:Uncharacterized protein n=1 Tax=Castanea mollissima TaxID=60419 RepID=A0A8J4RFW4_9ROSI|nr:hypothetical protein CMV_010188 [Castanea mollissima]